jgi:HEAT repeat protein
MPRQDWPALRLARFVLGCLLISLGAAAAAPVPPPKPDARIATIARLIEQLGDEKAARRDAAREELEKIGAPAAKALTRAMTHHTDLDVRDRARRVLGRIYATRIAALIDQLGAEEFKAREAANRQLRKIGLPAIEALERATRDDEDLLIRVEAGRALAAIKGK